MAAYLQVKPLLWRNLWLITCLLQRPVGIYSDIVAPELARLDRAVRTARRDLLKDLGRSVVAWTGAISFGMYTGLLPDQLLGAAKVLGATKILADLSTAMAKLISPRDGIKREDLYFLWRVRQMSQQHRR